MTVELRGARPEDFPAIAAIIESSYAPHDVAALPELRPASLDRRPFTQWGDPGLRWWLAIEPGGEPIGFALWRHHHRNVHLHCMFVAGGAQRRGVGSALVRHLHALAPDEDPRIDSLTLHVLAEASWARRFYDRHGYVERDPHSIRTDEESGPGDWIRYYIQHGWPGPDKLVMVRPARPTGTPAG